MTGIGREQHAPPHATEHAGAGNAGASGVGAGRAGIAHRGIHLPHDLHLHEVLGALARSLGRSLDLAGRGYCCTCNPIEDAATVTLSPGRNPTSAGSATHQPPTEVHPHENLSGK